MPEIKTIRVVNPDGEGFMVINEFDFDPKQHTKWEQRKPAKKVSLSEDNLPESKIETEQAATPTTDSELARIQELEETYQQEGWRAIADLAEGMGIEKPEKGWRDAIPLIAQRERQP